MNKEEYLHELETRLKKHLPKSEISDILRDYGEYFEDGRRQNKSDTEISAKLGSPEIIAQQFMEEYKEEKKENEAAQELVKIKESAAKSMNELKEKVSFSGFFSRIGHTVSSLFSCLGRGIAGIGGPLKSFFFWLCKFIKLAVILILLLFAEFIFLCFTGLFTFASISFLGIGIFGILAFICTFSFISVFFSASGLLSSIAITCAGLLCGLLVVFLLSRNIRLLKCHLSGKNEKQREGGEDYV